MKTIKQLSCAEPMRCELSELSLRGQFYYTYVLLSQTDGNHYVGSTDNLENRVNEHSLGHVISTKNRRPLKLVYYEACLSRSNARTRETYLKTAWGKRYLKSRINP